MIYITYNIDSGKVDSIAYSAERMIPAGRTYLPVTEEDWNAAQGKVMKVEDGKFVVFAPETKTVRTFAKDAIWVATKDMVLDETTGLTAWEAFKTFLLDSGLWEGWSMQAYLLEENPFFEEFYPLACDKLGKELVDRVLEASVVGSKTVAVE